MPKNKINIAVLLGDPSGIGPELISKLLSEEIINQANIDTSSAISSFTGKKNVYFLGYDNEPAINITQTAPLPMRILGITSEVYY